MTDRLTRREREILALASQHLISKQIGPRLGIQPASVDTFMRAILKKLGVASRKEAIRLYLETIERDPSSRDDHEYGSAGIAAPSTILPVRTLETGGASGNTGLDTGAASGLSRQRRDRDAERKLSGFGDGPSQGPGAIGTPGTAGEISDPSRGSSTMGEPQLGPGRRSASGPGISRRTNRRPDVGNPLLRTAARRLMLMVVMAVGLGFLTLGAISASYGLTEAFGRLFEEHVYNRNKAPRGPKVKPMTHSLTGARVAKQLFSTENSLDATLAHTGRLLSQLCEARLSIGLPAISGQKAIAGVVQTVSALEQARRSILSTHDGLAEIREEYGLTVTDVGVLPKPGEDTRTGVLTEAA